MTAALQANLRGNMKKSHAKQLRKNGRIPGVVYGKDMMNQYIEMDANELLQAIRRRGKNSVFKLQVSGGEPIDVMISEIQRNELNDQLVHVDFKKVNMNEPVITTVPVTLIGEARGVREGGVMQFQTRELEIRCLPAQIPDSIPLYVSELGIGESLTVADLDLPPGIELQHEQDEVIITITAPKLNPVEEAEEDTIQEPEIVGAKDGPGMDEAK